jgi:hypothetical protein
VVCQVFARTRSNRPVRQMIAFPDPSSPGTADS